MNVNPEDYDPEELRRMAEERHSDADRPSPGHNGESHAGHGREAPPESDGTGGAAGTGGRSFEFGQSADRAGARGPARRGRAADSLRSNQLEQLFLHQSSMTEGGMTKPYLGTLPQQYAAERVIFDWLEFLVLKGGFKRAMDALRYYRTIDWITEEVEADLQDYLSGFTTSAENSRELDVDDHQLSLVYLARLASMT